MRAHMQDRQRQRLEKEGGGGGRRREEGGGEGRKVKNRDASKRANTQKRKCIACRVVAPVDFLEVGQVIIGAPNIIRVSLYHVVSFR